jgi:hypothetical protein
MEAAVQSAAARGVETSPAHWARMGFGRPAIRAIAGRSAKPWAIFMSVLEAVFGLKVELIIIA